MRRFALHDDVMPLVTQESDAEAVQQLAAWVAGILADPDRLQVHTFETVLHKYPRFISRNCRNISVYSLSPRSCLSSEIHSLCHNKDKSSDQYVLQCFNCTNFHNKLCAQGDEELIPPPLLPDWEQNWCTELAAWLDHLFRRVVFLNSFRSSLKIKEIMSAECGIVWVKFIVRILSYQIRFRCA